MQAVVRSMVIKMKQNVFISVSGMQFGQDRQDGAEAEQIETVMPGVYYEKDGRHYVLYEETMDGVERPLKNTVKFGAGCLELIRRGPVNVHMVFEEKKQHTADYQIPYGSIQLVIDTKKIHIAQTSDRIAVHVDYVLDMGYGFLTDCRLTMDIRFKENE